MPTEISSDEQTPQDLALLSFMIGPVQPFIEAARTLRDLWSGSYLLAWLTASAMRPIIEDLGHDAIIVPHVDASQPLLAANLGRHFQRDSITLASLPNKFAAKVPRSRAAEFEERCRQMARHEWNAISETVHQALSDISANRQWTTSGEAWDRNWENQLEDFFEIRSVVLPLEGDAGDPERWRETWMELGGRLDMARSVRHVPRYEAVADNNGRFPAKCSLLGSYEQMGPSELASSTEYWQALREWDGLHGTRIQRTDRLCAVSLVKRFAWPAYFAGPNSGQDRRLRCDVRDLRFSDTATIAAEKWLKQEPAITPFEGTAGQHWRRWSGQWLHWDQWESRENGEDDCPKDLWKLIKAKRKKQGSPPAYYAILHMDGDNMGLLFEGNEVPREWGEGEALYREITRRLSEYSLAHVKPIVENHDGELIYAGGDDVLAVLPTATAIDCALELRQAFSREDLLGDQASSSAGLAIVHYKEDLRFALSIARAAERAAKRICKADNAGATPKKDALAVTICRHSGEQSTCVMGWPQTEYFQGVVNEFLLETPPSDRWAYKFLDELPSLESLSKAALRTELSRLLNRADSVSETFREQVLTAFDSYCEEMTQADRGWELFEAVDEFAKMCRTASFLARGKD